MKRCEMFVRYTMIALAFALAIIAFSAAVHAQPVTPINNPRLQGIGTVTGTLSPSGAGVITASVQQTLDLLSTTQGAIIYRSAGEWKVLPPGTENYVLATGGAGADPFWVVQGGGAPGSGTVTSIADGSTNGVTWTVATRTTTPVFTFSLGAITPSSVSATGTVTGSNLSGTNTGDQTDITGNAGTATALQTARTINGTSFDGTANITVTAAAGTLTGTTLNSTVTASSLLSAAGGSFGTAAFTAASAYEPALGNPSVSGYVLSSTTGGVRSWVAQSGGGGSGTVTSVSVVTANGVSGSVATDTTTPAITLTLGHITPTSVNGITLTGSSTPTLEVTGTAEISGVNTGDQTSVTGNAGTATALQTARTINGVSFDGTANITVTAAAGTLSGTTLASGVTASSLLSAAGGTFGTAAFTDAADYVAANAAITGATKTKITYDAKGLVTGGADATTADIADSTDKRYVTDADLTLLGNTSGTNTGDQNIFASIVVDGQTTVTTGSTSQALTLVAGDNVTIATDNIAKSVTINATSGGGTPGGSDTQVQFNDGGAFGGDAGLVFNKTTNALTVAGDITGANLSGTNTGDQTSVTGNAGTATALQTARNINGVSFDGTSDITVTAAAGTLSGTTLNSTVVNSSLTSVGTIGTGTWQGTAIGTAYGGLGANNSASSGVPLFASGTATFTGTSGTGNFARVTSPTFVTPTLGAASATSINGLTITPSTGTLTIANGKTATVSNSITFNGTDSTSFTFPSSSGILITTGAAQDLSNKNLDIVPNSNSPRHMGIISSSVVSNESITEGQLVALASNGLIQVADADVAGRFPAIGIALSSPSGVAQMKILMFGFYRNDSYFGGLTAGAPVYLSTTAGGYTATKPTTSGAAQQVVGMMYNGGQLIFNGNTLYTVAP